VTTALSMAMATATAAAVGGALHAELVAVRRQLSEVRSSEQRMRMGLGSIEQRRHDLKRTMLEFQGALIEAGVPTKQKSERDVPFWYSAGGSWQKVGLGQSQGSPHAPRSHQSRSRPHTGS